MATQTRVATEQCNTSRSIAQVVEVAHRVTEQSRIPWSAISSAGVAVPGIYYAATGLVWAPNLPGWDHLPLREELAKALPVPVVLDSDRAAYVTGEQWLGVARGLSDVIFVAVGTGIGAGIVSGGRLIRGAGDIAGAIGWFALDVRAKEIYKRIGCFEAEAAGPSLARRAGGGLTTEAVIERARQGDAAAQANVNETVRYLAMGVANLVSVLNPQMVVLGGGLIHAGELFLEPLRREMLQWAQPIAAKQVRIELSALGEDAGVLGAARLAFLGTEV